MLFLSMMQRPRLLSLWFTCTLLMVTLPAAYGGTTITLDQPVHFLTAEGSVVTLAPGRYQLEAAQEWLRVIPGERRDTLFLEAQSFSQEDKVADSTAVSGEGDEHILALVMPVGKSLQAVGSKSGT